MLYRKIEAKIIAHLQSESTKMLIVDGARQIGKSFIIRHVATQLFANYIEINMEEDKSGDRLFADVGTTDDFYLAMSVKSGDRMKDKKSTIVFIDEIQAYPHLLTLIKFLMTENRFTYIASGSMLGVTLSETQSLPIGYIKRLHMFPLDFEEFLIANGVGSLAIESMKNSFLQRSSLSENLHNKMMDLFRKYLLVGGLPDAVNVFVAEKNITKIREIQNEIHDLYGRDAAKYEKESGKKLKILRIYNMIPSNLENKKKRIIAKNIEDKTGKKMSDYQDEFDYLISVGISLDVKAISQPTYPLVQNVGKNLIKLYINDVGVFTSILYKNNIKAIMNDMNSINLGAVYETAVAQELKAHGFELFYYDNKQNGEVDYLIDNSNTLTVMPLEIKSGKDYKIHSALDKFLKNETYNIHEGFVFSNEREISTDNQGVTYLPIYDIMFFE